MVNTSAFGSKTPYRLYLPLFGPQVQFSQQDLIMIAENFDLCFGHLPSTMELDYIRGINSEFQAIRYFGSWTHTCLKDQYTLQEFEQQLRDAMLYYRAAILKDSISASQSRFAIRDLAGDMLPGTAHPDSTWSYVENGVVRFHTFLRLREECMRIVRLEGDTLEVERGFFGTVQAPHGEGSSMVSPLYNTNPNSPDRQSFAYHLDPQHPIRWQYLAGECLEDMTQSGADGIYIDILGSNTLRATRMDGVITSGYWDRRLDSAYSRSNYRKASELGIDFIQDTVHATLGTWPVIFGNNMTATTFRDGIHDRYKFLVPTEEKPRPIDGYMIEDAWGGYTIDQWVEFDADGTKIVPAKATPGTHGYRNWEMNIREVMECGENGWAAAPQMINGGMKNYAFEFLTMEEQHDWFLWACASYLLGVVVNEEGSTSTWQGITARISDQYSRRIMIDPCLQWKIGTPALTQGYQELEDYKVTGHTYLRPFSNGVVLVNPYTGDDPVEIDLLAHGGPFIDPDSGDEISTIGLKGQTGRILLTEYDPEDYPGYPDPSWGTYEGTPYYGTPFPVPEGAVPMPYFDRGSFGTSVFDPDMQPMDKYMPGVRDDDLDAYPFVELTGSPAGIFRVTHGEYWRYSIRVSEAGSYRATLHYGGSTTVPTIRTIRFALYTPDSMKLVYADTVTFEFGPGIENRPREFGGIMLEKGDYVAEWKGLYTGARPNLDWFILDRVLGVAPPGPETSPIQVFPTLCTTELRVVHAAGYRLRIHDMTGHLFMSVEITDDSRIIPVDQLHPGIYMVAVDHPRHPYRVKIIKAY